MAPAASIIAGQVLSIGEILIDFIVADGAPTLDLAETFVARSGGAPANVAVALARLDLPSAFCGVVGNDPFGSRLGVQLAAEGVDTSRLQRTDEETTTFAYAWKDERGDGHFWLLRGADTRLTAADAHAADIPSLAALVVGSVSLSSQPSRNAILEAVALAGQSGVPVVFDINLRPTLWSDLGSARSLCQEIASHSQLVKLSLDDATGLFGSATSPQSAIETVLAFGAQAVVLTDGERGSWFTCEPTVTFVPAFAVDAIEPTGAGDAFTAAIIARSLASQWGGLSVDDIRYAAAAGALATTRQGAWAGLPSRADLADFLGESDLSAPNLSH
ncbi:MAG: carbohydrate kinase [Chloroflexi bacterium]|nr:carbohydrate kinase [Chloroflexota bacterium]